MFRLRVLHKKTSILIRHLQHDIRTESFRIASHTYLTYDMSYEVGRMADMTYDSVRLIVYQVVYLPR